MNSRLKNNIQKAFDAPKPNQQEKKRFLRTIPQSKISMRQFIFTQATYIRKWTWFLSILLLIPALMGAYYVDPKTLWIISSFVPLLGLLTVTESKRSMIYGMGEFEMSTRFSLKSVLLARMSILGILDTLILCCLIPLCCAHNDFSIFQIGFYLFVPYLLSVNISLWVTRHYYNKEAIYGCMSVTIIIGVANSLCHFMAEWIYQLSYIGWWIILCMVLLAGLTHEMYHTIKQTEELAWNL